MVIVQLRPVFSVYLLADACVAEAGGAKLIRTVDIAEIDDDRVFHDGFQARQIHGGRSPIRWQ